MGKLSETCLPDGFQKCLRQSASKKNVDISKTHLTRSQVNPAENFHRRLVTQDETCVHHFECESTIQNKQKKLWFFTTEKVQTGSVCG